MPRISAASTSGSSARRRCATSNAYEESPRKQPAFERIPSSGAKAPPSPDAGRGYDENPLSSELGEGGLGVEGVLPCPQGWFDGGVDDAGAPVGRDPVADGVAHFDAEQVQAFDRSGGQVRRQDDIR